ncbi:MAG: hypothetical protein ACLQK8_01425 [Streptosporangiaceae bacterium]
MTAHQLEPAAHTTTDVFSRELPPVLTVDSGDTVTVRSDAGPARQRARARRARRDPAGRVTFGFSPDLNEAMGDALEAMLTWLQALYGLEKKAALAVASPVLDLRITQVANQSRGVHALLRRDAISRG